MKRFVKYFTLTLGLLLLLASRPLPAAAAPADSPGTADAQEDGALRFNEDGTFTILLLAGLQDTQLPSSYLLRSVAGVLRDYPPDLVVLLGDQLDGRNPVLRIGNVDTNVRLALARILAPIERAQVPFAALFGSGDYDAPLSMKRQRELYAAYPQCVLPGVAASDKGVAVLPVYGEDGARPLLNLYFFDAVSTNRSGAGAISEEQVKRYVEQSAQRRADNVNQSVPAVAFMNAAVPEIYELFSRASVAETGAVRGAGEKSDYYRLDSERIFLGQAQEAPSIPAQNNGLFDAFVDQNDVFLSVSGRDHTNSFIGSLSGVDLLSAPGSTFTGPNDRAVRGARLLRFTEFNVRDYETVHVRYSDYDAADGIGAIPYYLTTTTRIANWVKVGCIALLLAALLGLLILSVCRTEHDGPLPDMPPEGGDERPEDPYV